jgi:hypothetical protein
MTEESTKASEKGDNSKMATFYVAFYYGEEYRGDFRYQAWNDELGLKEITDEEIEEMIRGWLKELELANLDT